MNAKLSTVATVMFVFSFCMPTNAKAAEKPVSTISAASQSCDAEGIVSPLISPFWKTYNKAKDRLNFD